MGRVYFAMLLLSVFVVAGCGRSKSYSGPNGEKVTVNEDGGGVEINATGPDGGKVVFSGGKGAALPGDFPKDAPVYPGVKVVLSTNTKEGMTVMLETADAADKVVEFYEKNLKDQGWEAESALKSAQNTTLIAKKEKRTLAVNIISAEKVMIQLMVRQEK
jgi:hypothetical protein